ARPEYIAQGPDNTLWFTEKDGNQIGRITGIELPGGPGGGGNPPPPPAGTIIRWSQSEDAKVTIRFARRVRGRFRTVKRKMRFQSTAGNHRLRFRGRF